MKELGGPWFRGHSVANGLQPKLYRYSPVERDLRTIEDELRQEFVWGAQSYYREAGKCMALVFCEAAFRLSNTAA
jgi:hypothetical protein